ncbi:MULTISPECIES: Crp/Fnr family transcriptional regulator [Psychrilyobacter]|uniref:Crp/Fnr family transcriptional regulator n=1 Tax=Psychrilyobacter piezotolerans TaxID=2293438 RepID=A0ABX9KL32_9FUSO|nr:MULTISPECIES: Crp/Fnr family transcriptional regulator [Psychrilyobacter]MCS5422301.1 Crp/Fnr family transcriptional regulator [Psychrilyobacter sp. S5]NDI76501.1 Crp/Fnr family transcriptional regulator [Psychrilyobacter piezotolerans]RDE66092.1 Crp/Fnr family transcriptional regulator [Psychrilyobacter sp. S5]REI43270.1 Crp/Fnr family transcriptional regulator [Psychrilyobacter piezotolerans]
MKSSLIIEKFIDTYKLNNLFSKENINLFNLKKYSKGENILNAKDEVKHIYFIVSGGVDIHSFLASGRGIFINKLSPPEIFGDVEYLGETSMLFDVIANSNNTLIMSISFKAIETHLKDNSQLWRFLGVASTRKLLKTNSAILLKEGFNLKNILALHLVENDHLINFKSLNELSKELNVSYRNLTRIIKFFTDSGIIKKDRKSITTLDEKAIKKYAKEI